MKNEIYYRVAGHRFRLSFSDLAFDEKGLINLAPFRVEKGNGDYLFTLSVEDVLHEDVLLNNEDYQLVGIFDDDIASMQVLKSNEKGFRIKIAPPGSSHYCIMDVDDGFYEAKVVFPENKQRYLFYLNNCLMLLFAFSTAGLDTLMMHASVITNEGMGYMFLGRSGTGKSTHSKLWMDYIEGSRLLNDDNPVVRIIDGDAKVFGTPWSGKTPCYQNEHAILKGIVKLHQAQENSIKKLPLLQSYAVVLPACSNMRWEEKIASGIHNTVEKLVGMVPCYSLYCLPDRAAAELSASTIK